MSQLEGPSNRSEPPLEGLVVADFSRVLAGPLATMTLADLGANVIKVERPGGGDDTRSWGPPWTEKTTSYFESVNRSKSSVVLDLDDPADRSLANELARRADVVVHNFRAGVMERHGLSYQDVRATNDAVVYCSISGFGSRADIPGYDFVAQAVGGLMSITGSNADEPTKVGVAIVDVLTGKDAVIGILAALQARARDGVGQHVEVNLLSSLLGGLVNQASAFLTTGQSPHQMGNKHPSIAPYETLRCSDGLLAVACGNDAQFKRLAGVLGRSAIATDVRFATNAARVGNRVDLVDTLEAVLTTDTSTSWEKRLMGAGVPAGRVGSIQSAFELAKTLGLDPVVSMPDGSPGQVAHPIAYSRTTTVSPRVPPCLGEHGVPIREWLLMPKTSSAPTDQKECSTS